MRFDWNSLLGDLKFKHFSKDYFPKADALVDYLQVYAERYGLNIHYNTEATKISKAGKF